MARMRGDLRKRNTSSSTSIDGQGAIRADRNPRTIKIQPMLTYAASSTVPASQTRETGETRAEAEGADTIAAPSVRSGKGRSARETARAAAEAEVRSKRFQMLRRVGMDTGSKRRTAAAHQSAGKSLRGRCRCSPSRSARTSRISALPPKMAACKPVIPPSPPQALSAAQARLLITTDHSKSMQTAAPRNRQILFRPAFQPPPSAPAAL